MIVRKSFCNLFCMFLLVFSASGMGFGETGDTYSVVLENVESKPFIFALDPKGLAGANPRTSYFYGKIGNFLKNLSESDSGNLKLFIVKGGKSLQLDNLLVGEHLAVGYFDENPEEGKLINGEVPVRVIGITVKRGMERRVIRIEGEPVLLKIKRPEGLSLVSMEEMTSSMMKMGKDRWKDIPKLLSFSGNFLPLYFYRDDTSGYNKMHISLSRFWNRGGTGIDYLKLFRKGDALYILLESKEKISEAVSYFFYIYEERADKSNSATLELKPLIGGKMGGIVLWLDEGNGAGKPLYVGDVTVEGKILEGKVDLKKIPGWLSGSSFEGVSADFSSCYYDSEVGTYEEFPLATLYLKDIPVEF